MTVDTEGKDTHSSKMNVGGGGGNGNGDSRDDYVFVNGGDVVLSDCSVKNHESVEGNVAEFSLKEGGDKNNVNGGNGEGENGHIKLGSEDVEVANGHVKNRESEEVNGAELSVKEGDCNGVSGGVENCSYDNGVNGEIELGTEVENGGIGSNVEDEVEVGNRVLVVKKGSDQVPDLDEVEGGSKLKLDVDEVNGSSDLKPGVEEVKEVKLGFENNINGNASIDDIDSHSLQVDDNSEHGISDTRGSDQFMAEEITDLDSVPEPSEVKEAKIGSESNDNGNGFLSSDVEGNSSSSVSDAQVSTEVESDITSVSSDPDATEPSGIDVNVDTPTLEVPEGEFETEQYSVPPLGNETEFQGTEPEADGEKVDVIASCGDQGTEIPVSESESPDTLAMESKSLETGVTDKSVENGFIEQPVQDDVTAPLQLKAETENPDLVEKEAKSGEQGDVDPVASGESQESEEAGFELDQGEITDQSGLDLTHEAKALYSQPILNNSEGADNQCHLELGNPVSISIGLSDGSKIESTSRPEENNDNLTADLQFDTTQNSSVEIEPQRIETEESVVHEQITEGARSFDMVDNKDVSSEDFSTEKTLMVEETTSDAYKEGSQARAEASENNVVPTTDKFSEDAPCDSNIVDEQRVDDVSVVTDNSSSTPVDGNCSQPNLENNNCPITHPAHDSNTGTNSLNCEIDGAVKSYNNFDGNLRPNISFGSFESALPFSHNDRSINLQTDTLNKSTEACTTISETKVYSPNNVASLNSEANGDHLNELNVDTSCEQVAGPEQVNVVPAATVDSSESDFSDAQSINPDFVRKPFYWLVKIPRSDEEKHRALLRGSEIELAEKTNTRNALQVAFTKHLDDYRKLKSNLENAKLEAKAASDLLRAKRREVDSAQYLINLAKSITVEDVDNQILNLENTLQHESHTLKVERELVRKIRELNQQRQQLLADGQRQLEVKQALNQRDQTEEQLKALRKERDTLRDNLFKAYEHDRAAQKKHDEGSALLNHLKQQLISANDIRQRTYTHMMILRKQLNDKISPYYKAKNDLMVAYSYARAGQKDILEHHCLNQVEKVMEMWNKNDEFRKEYIKCNMKHRLRKFGTVDGTDLGINEVPPSLVDFSGTRVHPSAKVNSSTSALTAQSDSPVEPKGTEEKKKVVLSKKLKSSPRIVIEENKDEPKVINEELATKEDTLNNSLATSSRGIEIKESEEETKLTKEEEESAREEEQSRREEEAARLREQSKLEEKAKAQEALERKRRNEAKARAKAEFKAQKEAEEKEKEKEKREMKKQKKRGINTESSEYEPGQPSEPSSVSVKEPEVTQKPATVTKRPQKPSLHTKPIRTVKPIPPSLRNKGRRRLLQYWPYPFIMLLAVALFYLGNYETIQTIKQDISGLFHR